MGLFSTASKEVRVGVDFLPGGIAAAQVRSGSNNHGDVDVVNVQGVDRNLMTQMITTYLVSVLLVSLGFFGVGALASAVELRDPMQQPPAFAQEKYHEAKLSANPKLKTVTAVAPKAGP
jgi:hypothetical protein